MLVVMQPAATERQIAQVRDYMQGLGITVYRSSGETQTVLSGGGDTQGVDPGCLTALDGVSRCLRIGSPYKLVSREFKALDTVIDLGDVRIGSESIVVMAGPCVVESASQIDEIAAIASEAGAKVLRGGVFRSPFSPYSFQGLGEKGLYFLRRAANRYGLLTISEVTDVQQVRMVADYTDIIQIGPDNMQNVSLLRLVGEQPKPVLLKRGIGATIDEWLLSAEHIMLAGNYDVMLCERGIRSFETRTYSTMDIAAIPLLKQLTHLPVIADPSHGTGHRDEVGPMACAAVAAGVDGVLIEVHNEPDAACIGGAQSLFPEQFACVMKQMSSVASAIGRS
jgi:3-deoxy-7-phosphoheptulonate synthase